MSEAYETDKDQATKEQQSDTESDELDVDSEDSLYKKEDAHVIQAIINTMSEEELLRYETFRRTGFPKGPIKKFINNVIGQAVNPNMVIAVGGLAKVFVGEMVEVAKVVQKEQDEDGPLLPSHIHEAYRRLYNRMPNTKVFRSAPWD